MLDQEANPPRSNSTPYTIAERRRILYGRVWWKKLERSSSRTLRRIIRAAGKHVGFMTLSRCTARPAGTPTHLSSLRYSCRYIVHNQSPLKITGRRIHLAVSGDDLRVIRHDVSLRIRKRRRQTHIHPFLDPSPTVPCTATHIYNFFHSTSQSSNIFYVFLSRNRGGSNTLKNFFPCVKPRTTSASSFDYQPYIFCEGADQRF